jgi:hypothetical protein
MLGASEEYDQAVHLVLRVEYPERATKQMS